MTTTTTNPLDTELNAVQEAIRTHREAVKPLWPRLYELRQQKVDRGEWVITGRLNNCYVREECLLCGNWDRPGDIQFLLNGDSADNVCDNCTHKHAPDLYAAVRRLHPAEDALDEWRWDDEVYRILARIDGEDVVTIKQIEAAAEYIAATIKTGETA